MWIKNGNWVGLIVLVLVLGSATSAAFLPKAWTVPPKPVISVSRWDNPKPMTKNVPAPTIPKTGTTAFSTSTIIQTGIPTPGWYRMADQPIYYPGLWSYFADVSDQSRRSYTVYDSAYVGYAQPAGRSGGIADPYVQMENTGRGLVFSYGLDRPTQEKRLQVLLKARGRATTTVVTIAGDTPGVLFISSTTSNGVHLEAIWFDAKYAYTLSGTQKEPDSDFNILNIARAMITSFGVARQVATSTSSTAKQFPKSPDTSEWDKYQDQTGFAIKYPAGWQFKDERYSGDYKNTNGTIVSIYFFDPKIVTHYGDSTAERQAFFEQMDSGGLSLSVLAGTARTDLTQNGPRITSFMLDMQRPIPGTPVGNLAVSTMKQIYGYWFDANYGYIISGNRVAKNYDFLAIAEGMVDSFQPTTQ